eukprot:g2833.t1
MKIWRTSFLVLFVVFCGLGVEGFDSGQCPYSFQSLLSKTGLEDNSQYIVRFRDYRLASFWKTKLEGVLSRDRASWKWVERENPAMEHPTDFGVIQLLKMTLQTTQQLLLHESFFRDIYPDRKITRKLSMESASANHAFVTDEGSVQKRPGRFQTRFSFGIDSEDDNYSYPDDHQFSHGDEFRRKLLFPRTGPPSLTKSIGAPEIWKYGFSGSKVRVGVFDTGIRADHPHVKNIKERTNWTHQKTLNDGLGHGSFVAGVIAGSYHGCLGLAPDVELHTFKVFTDDQVSYTSWFMDAFNYAIISKMNIVNLSIGGPDYLDNPFVEKVLDVTSSGIIMVSAIGNDGPLFGTLNNPADQNDVIGIGGINYHDSIARFSSRGMSTWELPIGYGRIKPDVMAYAQDVSGSKMQSGCKTLSGTSVASPVAAGAVALLASTVSEDKRWKILNPASMKQALVEGATRLNGESMYVQGAGKINLMNSMKILQSYTPRASLIPATLNLTDCQYMWPFCSQPLYANAAPVVLNATILNGIGVTGVVSKSPVFIPLDPGGKLLDLSYEWSDVLWPWSGYLAIYIRVNSKGKDFSGSASGQIRFEVTSYHEGSKKTITSKVKVPLTVNIIPTPDRSRRILWDQFHSIKYPPAYLPRDNLDVKTDVLDWHGDHLHTNFHSMYNDLLDHGYYIEILGSPFTCFNASEYGTLLIVDPEDVFYPEEKEKLIKDVREGGLGLIIFAEWFNAATAKTFKFFDDNTRSWWTPATGGSNVPALNELLKEFGIAFGDSILSGSVRFTSTSRSIKYASGANIVRFPLGGYAHSFRLEDHSTDQYGLQNFYTLGLTEEGVGRIAVYGDSGCLDSSYQVDNCYELLRSLLAYASRQDPVPELVNTLTHEDRKLQSELGSAYIHLPEPMTTVNFSEVSFVLTHPLQCYMNSPVMAEITPRDEKSDNETMEALRVVQEVVHSLNEESSKTGFNHLSSGERLSYNVYNPRSTEWTPPILLTKWSALIGVVAMLALYRVARRRRQGTNSVQTATL